MSTAPAPSMAALMERLRGHGHSGLAAASNDALRLLPTLLFDDSDRARLALRAYDPVRRAFIGLTLTQAPEARLSFHGHCPQCPPDPALCEHARALGAALRHFSVTCEDWQLDRMRAPFVRFPSARTETLGLYDAEELANIFGAPKPAVPTQLSVDLTRWLNHLSRAEAEAEVEDTEDTRKPRLPDDAQLRFSLACDNAQLALRPVYMAPAEPHSRLRLVDVDGPTSQRRREILARLSAQERTWLAQLRGWDRGTGAQKLVFYPKTELDQQTLADWIGAGRVDLATPVAAGAAIAKAMTIGPDIPITLQWQVTNALANRLEVCLPAHGTLLPLVEPWWFDTGSASVQRITGITTPVLLALRQAPPVPRDQTEHFIAALGKFGLVTPVSPPPAVPDPRVVADVAPRTLVVLGAWPHAVGGIPGPLVVADVFFRYGRARIAALESGDRLVAREGEDVVEYIRQAKPEAAAGRTLDALGLRIQQFGRFGSRRAIGTNRAPLGATAIQLMTQLRNKGVQVELAPNLGVQMLMDAAQTTYTEVDDTGGTLVGVDTGIVIDGERVPLTRIAQAALLDPEFKIKPEQQDGERRLYVPIDDDRVVSLPHARVHELIAPFMEWLSVQAEAPRHAHAPRIMVPRTAMMAFAFEPTNDNAAWMALPGMSLLRDAAGSLRQFAQQPVAVTPPGFTGELFPYQRDGVRWLNTLGELGLGGHLADDMGLGKTIQVIAHVAMRREQRAEEPVLVTAPKSVVAGWASKLAEFAPQLVVLNLTGPDRGNRVGQIAQSDVVLVNYNTLRNDIEHLAKQHWSLAVFDESQSLKNLSSQSHAIAQRLDAGRVLMVSGTPLENHLGELYAQLTLALPGLLGSPREFTRFYRSPIEKHADDAARLRLRRRIDPFLLRRTKDEVLKDLPEKTEIMRTVALLPEQQKLYDIHKLAASREVWDALHTRGLASAQIEVLTQLTRLQQICCHPSLVGGLPGGGGSAKVDEILELVTQILEEKRRVVIVSQHVAFLKLIATALDKLGQPSFMFTGETKNRREVELAFQRGECPVLMLSLKAGGVGLDLTAADNVIIASPWWNPAAERQAIDRTHRIGQVNPVFAYRVVCENTIEVDILARQARKTALASSILDEDGTAVASEITIDDIVAMFGSDPTRGDTPPPLNDSERAKRSSDTSVAA